MVIDFVVGGAAKAARNNLKDGPQTKPSNDATMARHVGVTLLERGSCGEKLSVVH